VALKVTTTSGSVLFEGEVAPARPGGASGVRPHRAVFQATPGRLQFDLTILQSDGSKLDVGALDFEVPNVRGATPVILPPQLLSAGSAREFRDISAMPMAPPPAASSAHGALLLRPVRAYGLAVEVSAKLINRVGAVLICAMPSRAANADAVRSPLARFAPGDTRSKSRPATLNCLRADSLPHHRLKVLVRYPRAHALSHPLLLFLCSRSSLLGRSSAVFRAAHKFSPRRLRHLSAGAHLPGR
jgi:hypothetical protein